LKRDIKLERMGVPEGRPWRELLARRFSGPLHASSIDKRLPMGEALRRFVLPGMRLNVAYLQGRPNALVHELARQFRGTDPGFEFYGSSLVSNFAVLVQQRLLRKATVSFVGEGIPTPGPSPAVQRALARSELELENLTMLTIPQRLLAGAMGLPFTTTRSLSGSSVGEEAARAGSYLEIDDPFGSGETVGLLRAYQPDVALAHVWAADPAGNALVYPPFAENVYGLLAAKRGVILSAEKIVTTDFLRRHADHVRIPGEAVTAVCEAPYGSHPVGFYAEGIPGLRSYANDYDWIALHREATRDDQTYADFVDEWVIGVGSHEGYLEKLGGERLEGLHAVAEPDSWRPEIDAAADRLDAELPPSPIETMIVHAGRHLADRIRTAGFETVLAGVGQATLMSWLALHALRDEGIEIALMLETGVLGHDPRPADPFGFNYRNLPTARMLSDIFEILALHGGGAHNRCIGTLGAAQVDRHGNLNSTYGADAAFLTGSGGANDIASTAREVAVVAALRRGSFVEKVDYVTSPGRAVQSVTTNFGRFEKREGELVLTGYIESAGPDRESVLREIQSRCGFELRVADDLEALGAPSEEELALLRVFDPDRLFLGRVRT
jgi:acyl CoA:acetate/3-ketoacid CoA transferase alpha subunit/acyl CoA:acetate/3-ketoacid CoA transferase beta subunit